MLLCVGDLYLSSSSFDVVNVWNQPIFYHLQDYNILDKMIAATTQHRCGVKRRGIVVPRGLLIGTFIYSWTADLNKVE